MSDLATVKILVKALVAARVQPVKLLTLLKAYYEEVGHPLPYRELGFVDVWDFLGNGMREELNLVNHRTLQEKVIFTKNDSTMQHIVQMVKEQKRYYRPFPVVRCPGVSFRDRGAYHRPTAVPSCPQKRQLDAVRGSLRREIQLFPNGVSSSFFLQHYTNAVGVQLSSLGFVTPLSFYMALSDVFRVVPTSSSQEGFLLYPVEDERMSNDAQRVPDATCSASNSSNVQDFLCKLTQLLSHLSGCYLNSIAQEYARMFGNVAVSDLGYPSWAAMLEAYAQHFSIKCVMGAKFVVNRCVVEMGESKQNCLQEMMEHKPPKGTSLCNGNVLTESMVSQSHNVPHDNNGSPHGNASSDALNQLSEATSPQLDLSRVRPDSLHVNNLKAATPSASDNNTGPLNGVVDSTEGKCNAQDQTFHVSKTSAPEVSSSDEENLSSKTSSSIMCPSSVPLKDLKPTVLRPYCPEQIHVTSSASTDEFYFICDSDRLRVFALSQYIADDNPAKFLENPSVGGVNALNQDGRWVRVYILANDGFLCELLLIDYGVTVKNVPYSQMRRISAMLCAVPWFAKKASLAGVALGELSLRSQASEKFAALTTTSDSLFACLISTELEVHFVKLIDTTDPVKDLFIGDVLIELGLVKSSEQTVVDAPEQTHVNCMGNIEHAERDCLHQNDEPRQMMTGEPASVTPLDSISEGKLHFVLLGGKYILYVILSGDREAYVPLACVERILQRDGIGNHLQQIGLALHQRRVISRDLCQKLSGFGMDTSSSSVAIPLKTMEPLVKIFLCGMEELQEILSDIEHCMAVYCL